MRTFHKVVSEFDVKRLDFAVDLSKLQSIRSMVVDVILTKILALLFQKPFSSSITHGYIFGIATGIIRISICPL